MGPGSQERIPTSWLVILAAAGVLGGHAVAYWIAPVHAHADGAVHVHSHAYLRLIAMVVLPIAFVVLARIVRLEARTGRHLLSFRYLLGVQAAVFLFQEGAERIAAGGSLTALAGESVLWLGLGTQIVFAGLAVVLGRAALLFSRRRCRPLRQLRLCLGAVRVTYRPDGHVRTSSLRSPIRRRGPPAFVC